MQFGNASTTTKGFPIKTGHTYTMYFPIYQLMQILRANGYTVTWKGTEGRLNILVPEGVSLDLSNTTLRRDNAGIYFNDHPVQSFDKITQKDPKTGNFTTYLPLWGRTTGAEACGVAKRLVQSSVNGDAKFTVSGRFASQSDLWTDARDANDQRECATFRNQYNIAKYGD